MHRPINVGVDDVGGSDVSVVFDWRQDASSSRFSRGRVGGNGRQTADLQAV